jgi:hypothetical protein
MKVLGVLTVFAAAHKFLNRQSSKLSYFNDAVYPFYILHQTIILVVGYNLSKLSLGPVIEPILLLTFTVSACFIGYEIIRRTNILRPFFGLKIVGCFDKKTRFIGYTFGGLLIVPIGLEIIL